MKRNSRASIAVYFSFVRVLVAGTESGRSYTVAEMADRLEIASTTAWRWMRVLCDSDLAYVKEWRRVGKVRVACYAWGFKEDDEPRPAPLTQAQHERNYRQRKAKLRQSPMTVMAGHLT